MVNAIGWHFVGGFTEAECNEYFGILNDTRPACINIKAAEQYPQAFEFAKTCAKVYPEMRTIIRHMIPDVDRNGDDTGRHTRLTARQWWDGIGRQYIGTGLTVLTDNESSMENYSAYAEWQAEVMRYAGAEGVGIAYGRHPTHHPRTDAQWEQLVPMLKEAGRWKRLHTYSPNIYYSRDNLDGLKAHNSLLYWSDSAWPSATMTVGEFGMLRDIRDAHHGWRDCAISGHDYALYVTAIAQSIDLEHIPLSMFAVGKWPIGADTFSVDREFINTIKANPIPYKFEPPMSSPTPTPPPQPFPPLPVGTVTLTRAAYERLLATAQANAAEVRRIAGDFQVALTNVELMVEDIEKIDKE